MKKIVFTIIFSLGIMAGFSCDTSSSGPPELGTTLGFDGEDYAYSIEPTSDDGYFIVGYTNSVRNNYDLYALKTDKKFNVQWSKTFGNSNIDKGYRGLETQDGGFVVLGTIYTGLGNNDILCVKLDRRGRMLWSQRFGGDRHEDGRAIAELPDGSLVIAGSTLSSGNGDYDILLIKVNALGEQQWSKTYGGASTDRGFDIKKTSDGGLAVTGRTSSYGGVYKTFVLKTDAEGNQQWFTTTGLAQDEGQSIVEMPGGGFLTMGRVYVGLGNYQTFMTKVHADGTPDTTYILGFTSYEEAYSITTTGDSNYVVAGETILDNFTSDYQVLIFKVTSTGNVLWVKSYGGEKDDIGYSIRSTGNGYVVAGYTLSYGHGKADVYLLKIDEDGELQ